MEQAPPACSCAYDLYGGALEEGVRLGYGMAGAVFVGRVVAHNQHRPDLDPDGEGPIPPPPSGDPASPYFFVVEESFKGPRQRLFGAYNDPMCGLSGLDVGDRFLIYAFGGPNERGWEHYALSMCTRSREIGGAGASGDMGAEVELLRRLSAE